MTARLRRRLTQGASFVLAGVLLFLALRGVDLAAVGEAVRHADYRWAVPLVAILLGSHVLRAWRWKILVEALPSGADEASDRPVSLKTAFYSLMIGYMVNYAAPRIGEVARTGNLAAQERRSFSGVLGTVVVERVLDVVVLFVGLGSLVPLLWDRGAIVEDIFIEPLRARVDALPVMTLLGIAVVGGLFMLLGLRWILRREDARLHRLWHDRVRPVLEAFTDGLATVLRSPRRLLLIGTTIGIWVCYWLLTYVPFIMLGMAEPFGLTLADAWVLLVFGAVGVTIPSPGGIGSYHYITIQALVFLYGVDATTAASYAVFSHGSQMVIYLVVGVACLLAQGTSYASFRRGVESEAAHELSSEERDNG